MITVSPKILEIKAKQILTAKKRFSRRSPGKIVKTELIYFPYYTFELTLKDKKETKKIFVGIDGVEGSFALLNLQDLEFSKKEELSFNFLVSQEEAQQIALQEYKNFLFEYKMHHAQRNIEVSEIKFYEKISYPYWVGYFKKKNSYNFSVLDAVTGKKEGIKARPIFLKAFIAEKERK